MVLYGWFAKGTGDAYSDDVYMAVFVPDFGGKTWVEIDARLSDLAVSFDSWVVPRVFNTTSEIGKNSFVDGLLNTAQEL
ncbi:MAG: hypothetical protein LBR80_02410 [Deltaproteobacteria bacterium]|nr:hypothetical protein [Deltaproteobacteria bacterium]